MPTQHLHRLLILCPAGAKTTAVANWLRANIGANTVPDNLGPGLSPTGAAPATYRWCNAAFRDLECREILKRLCTLASVTPPTNAQWSGWSRPQKRSWLVSVRNAIWMSYGVLVSLADNEGEWDRAQDALDFVGVQPITQIV